MGKNMDIDVDHELCAALKHEDKITNIVYKRVKRKFRKHDKTEEIAKYYGGSDACQGDSGGPL